ncbi:hypothetical protein DUNSADRAFT_1723 [Dunaliella salina]|uniref:Glucosamine inositolphosphorylceramide transferase 1 N-terminal domain-containing protein n=1 Tax=Dunaliella salina TaxID=3046 RepID=A0ABQ7FX35_DUNSA|nr:hypothetical protein DUNSADRAFT_1723 [Dunaliella salina]|eukprot:KAF5826927.1 hypothetical protein DUNSADRAFT_1723 [Dunaliella salina]
MHRGRHGMPWGLGVGDWVEDEGHSGCTATGVGGKRGARNISGLSLFEAGTLITLASIACLSLELATGHFHLLGSTSSPPTCGSTHASTLKAAQHKLSAVRAQTSDEAMLDCKAVGSHSGVSSPYLTIDQTHRGGLFVFYQLRNGQGRGEIGVGSQDSSARWMPLGTALKGRHSLASPWVTFDPTNDIYIMLPTVYSERRGSSVEMFTTSKEAFPFGWQSQGPKLQEGPDLFGDGPDHFEGAAALHFDGQWWIFVTVQEQSPSQHFHLRLFHTTNLTDTWEEHARSPVCMDQRYARNGGRPVVIDGSVHRWAQDASTQAGQALHLLKLSLSLSSYSEAWMATRYPSSYSEAVTNSEAKRQSGLIEGHSLQDWHQLRHIDVQQVGPNGGWMGLMEGAASPPGTPSVLGGHHHYNEDHQQQHLHYQGEAGGAVGNSLEGAMQWVRGVLVVLVLTVWLARGLLPPGHPTPHSSGRSMGQQRLANKHRTSPASLHDTLSAQGGSELEKKLDGPALQPLISATRMSQWTSVVMQAWARLSVQLVSLLLVALGCSTFLFLIAPKNFQCPRWAIKVNILPSPSGGHTDAAAPFFPVPPPAGSLKVVSAANAPFFDRLQNMVASVQAWAPGQRVAMYDLGFTRQQLLDMACWQDVEVRSFPFSKLPPHVRDLHNYAFKALVIQEALVLNSLVLWIDAGLELRAPMYTMQSWLSQHGHVGALQEDNIGDPMYTRTKATVDAMGLSHFWPRAAKWQFCAGGLQGFVRGSDAERLVLGPVVNCSLRASCIAPHGASRANHNFDQTAFTLAIRANNYTCLPRETHCMWSTKKAARAPMQPSQPIEVVSRGHRLPKPYTALLKRRPQCSPLKEGLIPWAAEAPAEAPPWARYSLGFRLQKVYLQPIGDALVQAGSCWMCTMWRTS